MTDEVRKMIDGLPIRVEFTGKNKWREYIYKSDVIELVEKLTGWNKVEDCLPPPSIFKPNQSRFRQSDDVLLKCKSGYVTIGWYDFPTESFFGHNINSEIVTEWKPII